MFFFPPKIRVLCFVILMNSVLLEPFHYVKGPVKAVTGHKIDPNRLKTTYRSVLTFEEKKQSITHLFKKKKFRPRLGLFILAKRSENTVN